MFTLRSILVVLFLLCSGASRPQATYVDSLIRWTEEHPKVDSHYIQTLHSISYRLSETDIQRSFDYYARVALLSDSLHFSYGKTLAQINLGILLANSANFEGSNNAFFKAIDEARTCGALRLQAIALNNIGDNFNILKDYDRSKEFTRKAIVLNTQLKAWRGIAINYELLQRCALSDRNYPEAKNDLEKGMSFALLAKDSYVLSQLYLGFGRLKAIAKEKDSAAWYFDLAIKEARKQKDLRNEFNVFLARSQYSEHPDARIVFLWLDSALRIARKTQYLQGVSEASEALSAAYDRSGNKDSSLAYYRIYRASSDSLFSEHNKRNVIIKESEWIIRGKEIENRRLKELTGLQGSELRYKNGLLLALIFFVLLTAIASVFVNRVIYYRKKRERSYFLQRIAETQLQALRAQMNPHFVFNSLNSIENLILQNNKRLASDYFSIFSGFLRSVLNTNLSERVDLGLDLEALQRYVDLEKLRFGDDLTYLTEVEEELLRGKYLVPSLLMLPFLENAITQAFMQGEAGGLAINLKVSLEKQHIVYVLSDNVGNLNGSQSTKIVEDRITILNQISPGNITMDIRDEQPPTPGATNAKVIIRIRIPTL